MRKQMVFGAVASRVAPSSSPAAAAAAAAPAEPSETRPTATAQELAVWVDENREPAVEAAAAAFEEETGATVTLVQKNFEDIRNDFIAQVPTGEGPDITVGAHDWLGALVAAGVVDTIDLGDKAVRVRAGRARGDDLRRPALRPAVLARDGRAHPERRPRRRRRRPTTWDEMIQMGIGVGRRASLRDQHGRPDRRRLHDVRLPDVVRRPGVRAGRLRLVHDRGRHGRRRTARRSRRGSARNGETGTGLHLDDDRLRHQQRAVQHRQGRRSRSRARGRSASFPDVPTSQVSPIPSAGGETGGAVRRRAGLLPELAEQERAARAGVPRELPRHRGRAAARSTRPTRASRRGRRSPTRSSSDPIIAGLPRVVAERRADAEHPRDGLGLGPLERRAGADHQRRRPRADVEHRWSPTSRPPVG